jgi:hypothetical protein
LQTLCYIHLEGLGVGERVKLNFKRMVAQSLWIGSLSLLSSAPAQAESKARGAAQCVAKQKQMQQLEQAGHLREAKDMALEPKLLNVSHILSQFVLEETQP